MDTIKDLYEEGKKKGHFTPKLELFTKENEKSAPKPTGIHAVKMLGAKTIKGIEYKTNKERAEVELLVEEDGEKKIYKFPVIMKNGKMHYLIERLKGFNEGDEFIMEGMKNGQKNFIDVRSVGEDSSVGQETEDEFPTIEQDEEIPIIEEKEDIGEPPF